MTEIIEEVKEVEEVKKDEKYPILAMRYIHFTSVEAKIALGLIKPYAEELAKQSGEYGHATIIQGIYSRAFTLYLGYTVKTEHDKDVIEHLGSSFEDVEAIDKDFAGYIIVEPNYIVRRAHIWQAYIMPKYMNTNLLKVGMKWLLKELKEKEDIKSITMSSPKEGWHRKAIDMGFTETYTITGYKMEI